MDLLIKQDRYIQKRQDEIMSLVNNGDSYAALERCQIVVRKMNELNKLEDALIFLMKVAMTLADRGEWHAAVVCASRSMSQFPSRSKQIRVVLKQLYFEFADRITAEAVCPELFEFYALLTTFFHDQHERLLLKQAFLSDSANHFYFAQGFYIDLLGKYLRDSQAASGTTNNNNNIENNENQNNENQNNENQNNENQNNENQNNENQNNEETNVNVGNDSQQPAQISPEQQQQNEKTNNLISLMASMLWRWVLSQEGADKQLSISQYIFSRCIISVLAINHVNAVQIAKKLLAEIKAAVPTEVSADSEKFFTLPMFRFAEFFVKAVDQKSAETADFLIKKYKPAIDVDIDLIDIIEKAKRHTAIVGDAGLGGLGAMLQNILGGMFGGQGA